MIGKVNNEQMPGFVEKSGLQGPDKKQSPSDSEMNVSFEVDWAALINKAIETKPEEAGAVERAQKLLLSGQLDSADNARRAAENIIDSGI
jgi:hypothetical protein